MLPCPTPWGRSGARKGDPCRIEIGCASANGSRDGLHPVEEGPCGGDARPWGRATSVCGHANRPVLPPRRSFRGQKLGQVGLRLAAISCRVDVLPAPPHFPRSLVMKGSAVRVRSSALPSPPVIPAPTGYSGPPRVWVIGRPRGSGASDARSSPPAWGVGPNESEHRRAFALVFAVLVTIGLVQPRTPRPFLIQRVARLLQ